MFSNKYSVILVVEDSDDDFEFTEKALLNGNFSNPIKRCSSGEDALNYIFQMGNYNEENAPRPGLILLDLNMYGTDGREVLKQVKSVPNLRRIPIIVLTNSPHERDIESSYELGANSFVQKPVDMENFYECINNLMNFWTKIAILPKGETVK